MTFNRIVFDAETNGLLPDVSKLWCISIGDLDTRHVELFTDYDPTKKSISDAVDIINSADMWANHNIIGYDIPVLRHLDIKLDLPRVIVDTLLVSKILYPHIQDYKFPHVCPRAHNWSHSLEAWGHRLGDHKGEYDDWSRYTSEMGVYNMQDSRLNIKVFNHLEERAKQLGIPWEFNELPNCLAVETQFALYIQEQITGGFPFDKKKAESLVPDLLKTMDYVTEQTQEVFPPITETITYFTKVRKEKKEKTITTIFNPGSRQQIASRLIAAGWAPTEFTNNGAVRITDETLEQASKIVPEAATLSEYFRVQKVAAMLVNGDNAWLKLERKGRIHGGVNTLGAVTTRVTHNTPNLSQVPAVGSFMGEECRSLFTSDKGFVLVGADLSGIELRCLAHYLAYWDEGAYGKELIEGDVHTRHAEVYQSIVPSVTRSSGKTVTYCYLYGGGEWKMGYSAGAAGSVEEVTKIGRKLNKAIEKNIPALAELKKTLMKKLTVGNKAGKRRIKSIAGHPLYVRHNHAALNTLLQSCGAQVAKVWYVTFHRNMEKEGYVYGIDYRTYGFFHDEIQVGCLRGLEEPVGEIFLDSAKEAGRILGIRVPIDAEYKVGNNWSETH